jgi:hypothetical protein
MLPDMNIYAHFAPMDGADTKIGTHRRPFCGEGKILSGFFFGVGD